MEYVLFLERRIINDHRLKSKRIII